MLLFCSELANSTSNAGGAFLFLSMRRDLPESLKRSRRKVQPRQEQNVVNDGK